MARSHHRKKHKEHLRQYQHNQESGSPRRSKKGKVSGTFAIIGVILGAAIGYFVTDGVILWVAFGAVGAGLAGWLAGRYFDKEGNK